jgi:phosphoglycerol transferase MdoB-like AlkP superfamily enzyme
MFDGWYSALMILLIGLLATLLAVIVGWRLSKKNRKTKSAKQRRADRIDLTGRARE